MALENGTELLETWEGNRVERKAGLCIIAFLDVDWAYWEQQCDELRSGNTKKVWKPAALLYQRLCNEIGSLHPVLEVFARNQLIGDIKNLLMERFTADTNIPEWRYVDALEKGQPPVKIQEELPRLFLRQWSGRFSAFTAIQKKIVVLLDAVYDNTEKRKDLSVLQRYYLMRQENREYPIMSRQLYATLKTQFRLSIDGKLCEDEDPCVVASFDWARLAEKNISAHTYQTTDHLEALVLWELDDMAANGRPMRRCDYCGRYFLPYSVANCYCDRPVDGNPEKTCKEVGAATKHQKEVNADAAKNLYRKVNNRTQQAAKRYESKHPDVRKVNYRNWQYEARQLLEQVGAGTLDYETFAAAIDKTPKELLGI
ncbi:MAG: DUF6076 domain-containing protein [Oscillibacter sp.]|nr:DUF6076 domain-containing protein [Oscillibacter sp.]